MTAIASLLRLRSGLLVLLPLLLTSAFGQYLAVDWGKATSDSNTTLYPPYTTVNINGSTSGSTLATGDFDFDGVNDDEALRIGFGATDTLFSAVNNSNYLTPGGKIKNVYFGAQVATIDWAGNPNPGFGTVRISGTSSSLEIGNAALGTGSFSHTQYLSSAFYCKKADFLNGANASGSSWQLWDDGDAELKSILGTAASPPCSLSLTTGPLLKLTTVYFLVQTGNGNWYVCLYDENNNSAGVSAANTTFTINGATARWAQLPSPATNQFLNLSLWSPSTAVAGSTLQNIVAFGVYALSSSYDGTILNTALSSIAGFRAYLMPPTPISWASYMDFFTQDVCLDSTGAVMPGVSPLDARYNTANPLYWVSHRDMTTADKLTYYSVQTAPNVHRVYNDNLGQFRTACFPYNFPGLSGVPASLRFFDARGTLGNGVTSTWGGRDYSDTAMRTMWVQSARPPAYYGTISYGSVSDFTGPTTYNGPFNNSPNLVNITDPRVRYDAGITLDSSVLMQSWDASFSVPAPAQLRRSFIPQVTTAKDVSEPYQWYMQTVRYTRHIYNAPNAPTVAMISEPILTLISHQVPASSHNERTYYTRELGYTRHETWEDLTKLTDPIVIANDRSAAAALYQDALNGVGYCTILPGATVDPIDGVYRQVAPPPDNSGDEWVTTGCFEMTDIYPIVATGGDDPTVWIDPHLTQAPLFAPLFNVTPAVAPTVTSISPTTGQRGDTITVNGSGFCTTAARNVALFNYGALTGAVQSADGAHIVVTVPAGLGANEPSGDYPYTLTAYNDDITAQSDTKDANGNQITITFTLHIP